MRRRSSERKSRGKAGTRRSANGWLSSRSLRRRNGSRSRRPARERKMPFTQGKSSRGRAWGKRGRGRRAGQREPLGRRCRRTRRPARGPCFWRGSAGAWRRPRRAGSRLPGRSRARPALRLRAWTRRTATRCMRGRRWRSCCGPSGGRRARRPAKHCSPAGDMVH